MCENQKNIWTPDNYEEDQEHLPRGLYHCEDLDQPYGEIRKIDFVGTTQQPTKIARAILAGKGPNLLGSLLHYDERSDLHAPLIDLDSPHRYKKSSTRGHGHLLVDRYVSHEDYKTSLEVLYSAGIVQHGYAQQLHHHGQTFVRWNTYKDQP